MKIDLQLDYRTILANQARPVHFALRFQVISEPTPSPAATDALAWLPTTSRPAKPGFWTNRLNLDDVIYELEFRQAVQRRSSAGFNGLVEPDPGENPVPAHRLFREA